MLIIEQLNSKGMNMEKKQISKGEFNRKVVVETNYQRFVQKVEAQKAKQLGRQLVEQEYQINESIPNSVELN
jgi:hypothetical protein